MLGTRYACVGPFVLGRFGSHPKRKIRERIVSYTREKRERIEFVI